MKALTMDMVSFTIETEENDESVDRALSFETTGADHSAYIKRVHKYQHNNIWLWCQVTVTAKYKGLEGHAYLGGCAYDNEKDFKKGGYYEQMQEEAFEELKLQVEDLLSELC